MPDLFQLSPEIASPEFIQALQALIQIHAKELANATGQRANGLSAERISNEAGLGCVDTLTTQLSKISETVQDELKKDEAEGGIVKTALDENPIAQTGALTHGPAKEIALFGDVAYGLSDGTEIDEPEYDVSLYYKDSGLAQLIARSSVFGYITLVVICANAIYLGVESDHNNADPPDISFTICDNIFCSFFVGEWLCRFIAFRRKSDCVRDAWFNFDSFLVFTMVLDTWLLPLATLIVGISTGDLPTGPLKMLRVARLARMVRICHSIPELATLMKGIFVATRAVTAAVLLLIVIIYVWAIAMHALLKDEEEVYEYWGTVTRCMMTLIANGTLGDSIGDVMRGMAKQYVALIFFFAFVLLSAITVTNMLIGLLCEVVSEVANAEKEYAGLSKLKSKILVALRHLDKEGSGDITQEEFLSMLTDPDAKMVLSDLSIDVKHLIELTDMLYSSCEVNAIKIPEIMQLLLDSQGNRQPTFQDLVTLLGFTRWSLQQALTNVKIDMKKELEFHKEELSLLKTDLALHKSEIVSSLLRGMPTTVGSI